MNTSAKMSTPEYILDIRNGKYLKEAAIYKILSECHIDSFPINVWEIARILNFEVLEANFKDDHTSGILIDATTVPKVLEKFGTKRAIILNKKEPKNVQSFTIAHELGHFIYEANEKDNLFSAHHICKAKQKNKFNLNERKKKNNEDQMDEFAAMLLMPEKMFKNYIRMSNNRYDKMQLAEEMAKVCMVEEEAVLRRFSELRIKF